MLPPIPHPRLKVVLLGPSGCGKSTLARALVDGGQPAKRSRPTIGADVFILQLKYQGSGADAPSTYFVELWDISAHSRYAELRPLFYADVNGALLMFDPSMPGGESSVHKWANELASQGSFAARYSEEMAVANIGELPVPVLVVSSKSDLSDTESNGRSLRDLQHSVHSMWSQANAVWMRSTEAISCGVAAAARRLSGGGSSPRLLSSRSRGQLAGVSALPTSALSGLSAATRESFRGYFCSLIERRFFSGASTASSTSPATVSARLSQVGGPEPSQRRPDSLHGDPYASEYDHDMIL